jgi:hypothetical protein
VPSFSSHFPASDSRPAADRAVLAELIAALSRFAADHTVAIDELHLNPVIVQPEGRGLTIVAR